MISWITGPHEAGRDFIGSVVLPVLNVMPPEPLSNRFRVLLPVLVAPKNTTPGARHTGALTDGTVRSSRASNWGRKRLFPRWFAAFIATLPGLAGGAVLPAGGGAVRGPSRAAGAWLPRLALLEFMVGGKGKRGKVRFARPAAIRRATVATGPFPLATVKVRRRCPVPRMIRTTRRIGTGRRDDPLAGRGGRSRVLTGGRAARARPARG